MTVPSTILPIPVIGWALSIGAAADLLFRGSGGLGPNAVIVVALLVASAAHLSRGLPTTLPDRWLLTALGFALCLMWRDAELVRTLDALAIAAALSLTSLAQRVAPWRGLLRDYAATAARSLGHAAGGAALLVTTDGALRPLDGRRIAGAGPALAGLAIALPVVAVFAGLFASADPVFERFLQQLTSWNPGPLASHAATIALVAWLGAGLLRGWLAEPVLRFHPQRQERPVLSPVTVGIVVGSMTTVFVLFIASQSRQLFGGATLIEATAGLTYAEHARRGFFELVAASGLAIQVLMAADTALAGAGARARANFRALGSLQLILIALVMTSAFHRVGLYISMYGLTVDRLAGMAILVWLAVVTGWFALTVLRGRPERFTFGAAVSGFAVLGALNAVNPEALIARVNTRAAPGRAVDYEYLLELSGDAVPALIASLAERPPGERCEIAGRLRRRWVGKQQEWRNWNRGHAAALREARALTATASSGCPPS